jgi:hypothetical protein
MIVGRSLISCLAFLFAGCSPIVDAQFSDIVVTRPDIKILAAPTASLSSVTFSFSLDSTTLGANSNPNAQRGIASVGLHRLALTAKKGISDLSFIETLHALACVPIDKSSTTTSARQVEIADYVRSVGPPVGATFDVPIPESVDLLPLLRPSSTEPRRIVVIVNLGGAAPTVDWWVDISMSLSIELRQ